MRNSLDGAVPPVPAKLKKQPVVDAEESQSQEGRTRTSSSQSRSYGTTKFVTIDENTKTQFNKRIPKKTADTFALLAIKTNIKIPDLLNEAAEMLEEKYGNV